MSSIAEIKINNFSGGASDDPRENDATKFQTVKHFDIFSQPNRLTPYRSLEADTHDGSTATGMKQYLIQDFVYASTSTKLYGLGQTGAGLTKIVHKAVAESGNWTLPANSEGNGAVKNGCFVEFKDYLWGFQGNNQIFKYGLLSGTPTITNSASTVASTISSVAQGIIASDGNMYMAYNNAVVRVAPGGTITDVAKTVPTNFKITSLVNYGNYMAIGCAPVSNYNGVSKVFLWNLSSDLFQETIDWGEGELRILENIEGMLVGVTDRYLNSAVGAGKGSMIIQIWQGGSAQVVKEVFTKALTGKSIPLNKAVKNNRLFWAAKIMTNTAGTEYNEGIWSFGRKNINYPFSLSLDVVDESATTSGIQAFGTAANFFYISHSGDGSLDKTNDVATYTYTSIYESQILTFGEVDADKTLQSLKVSFRKLITGESLVAKYRVNGATAWTTIGTFTTADELSHTFLNIEATGDSFTSGKEYEIRLESLGGLEITGLHAKAIINNNV